jgi:YegS/Rv2252/BmrU family lipid kinase
LRRLVAILNPHADRGRTAQLAESLRDVLGSRFELELLETTRRGEAASLAIEVGQRNCEAVIAIGGDGTVHEVANGLMQLPEAGRPALGILPAGSGNDVAYALGVTKDLRRSTELIERGETRAVDVGNVRARDDESCFCINNIGLLLEGEINWASHRLRWPRGSGLYIRAMLQTLIWRLPTANLKLTVDGKELRRTAAILSIGNGPRSGGKFQLMPDATLDDGQFDYILASPVSRLKLLWKVRHAMAGKRLEGPWIERGRFSNMRIESDNPIVAHVDGEPWLAGASDIHTLAVNVMPKALQVLCP